MAAPSKELERLFVAGLLEHGNHPVLEWMFGNATYRKDPAGNIKPDKERAAEKIDKELTILTPEADEADLRAAGFQRVDLFYTGFCFRGWVAYANS